MTDQISADQTDGQFFRALAKIHSGNWQPAEWKTLYLDEDVEITDDRWSAKAIDYPLDPTDDFRAEIQLFADRHSADVEIWRCVYSNSGKIEFLQMVSHFRAAGIFGRPGRLSRAPFPQQPRLTFDAPTPAAI